MVAEDILVFQPAHQLWSDAAEKRRWIRLPPGSQIDTAEMDHWQFPVGTKLWKQFGHAGMALETRLVERYGPGPEDYWMGSFVWSADGTAATLRRGRPDQHQRHPARRPRGQDLHVLPPRRQGPGAGAVRPAAVPRRTRA